jgi:type III secretory pathway component EscU
VTAHAYLLVWLCKFANGERQTCEREIKQRLEREVKREAKEMEMWVFVRLEKRQMQGAEMQSE